MNIRTPYCPVYVVNPLFPHYQVLLLFFGYHQGLIEDWVALRNCCFALL